MSVIIDPRTGKPFSAARRSGPGAVKVRSATTMTDLNSFLESLGHSGLDAANRARRPHQYHAWVFAAARAQATTASQAPFTVFRETEEALGERRRVGLRSKDWTGHKGAKRRAMQRHSQASLRSRLERRGLEPAYDHPIMDVWVKPNPFQDHIQFTQSLIMWMALRGEVCIVATDQNGQWVMPGQVPDVMWPMSPDLFQPVVEALPTGPVLTHWEMRVPKWLGNPGSVVKVPATSLIQVKYANVEDPLRGLSPISAAATAVETDLMISTYNRAVLQNGGDPGGILMYDQDLDDDERSEILRDWNDEHGGPDNAKRTRVLSQGFRYVPLGIAPKDMEYLEQKKWDRSEVLAVMGTPPSQVGSTEFTNYATHLGEKRNFWDNTIIPLLRLVESAFDGGLFHGQPDSVVGLFDLSDVEALRSGLEAKVQIVNALTGPGIHMPPRTAMNLVGMEVEAYPGDDVALVPGLGLSPVEDVLDGTLVDPMLGDDTETGGDAPVGGDEGESPSDPGQGGGDEPLIPIPTILGQRRTVTLRNAKRWKSFRKILNAHEIPFRGAYRRWVAAERRAMLDRFDAAFGDDTKSRRQLFVRNSLVDFLAILPDLQKSGNALKLKVRPRFTDQMLAAYEFTVVDLDGVPTFELDDPAIVAQFKTRENLFTGKTPATVRRNLENAVRAGLEAGETVEQIRTRVAQVYKVSASGPKSLQVARTETANFMNGSRDAMFEAQGIEEEQWIDAEDEATRETHLIYGNAGPKPRGFNYLSLVGKESLGILAHPGDLRAPAGEIINCRCVKVPV